MEKETLLHRSLRLRGDECHASARTCTSFFHRLNGSSCSVVVVGNGSSQQWSRRSTIGSSVNLPIETEYKEFGSNFTTPHSPGSNTGATLEHYPRVMQHSDIFAFREPPQGQSSPHYQEHQFADDKGVICPPGFDAQPPSPVRSTQGEVDAMMISNTCLLDIDDALSLATKGETLECYKIPDDGRKVNTSLFCVHCY